MIQKSTLYDKNMVIITEMISYHSRLFEAFFWRHKESKTKKKCLKDLSVLVGLSYFYVLLLVSIDRYSKC